MRAAEIAEDDDARALVGGASCRAHTVLVCAEAAVREAARGLDAHVRAGHLRCGIDKALRERRAMRYDYDPDHGLLLILSPG